ncbi:hypothetical protein D3273_11755 [Lichenibacterium minor]|uniref:Uncharacterized protein n=1 Tax=Lichenibacterium minor TaxID=2316528 RepID=A0A4Q2U7C9_9HYPH|nr:hypothetical protein [Lichenibacterium minor]RYC31798.1 hypothetical protein D3273_11755 [Lichenibacterium minor]
MAFTASSLRALAAGVLLTSCFCLPARAAENYVIPASDEYGIGECMHAGMDCGRVIADSWCESHGHAHVLAYGTVEDVTGSIQASTRPEVLKGDPRDIVIRCGD